MRYKKNLPLPSSLLPAPCSLLPAPCSQIRCSQIRCSQIRCSRQLPRSLLNCVSTSLRTDICPPALSRPDLLLFGLGANDDSSLDRFVSSPRKFCCCQTNASNSLF
ncbi:MAG: hypothetical protein F6K50_54530 [Moorea sp. SIO3I7]|nr:hypothetical protein [Moorena sp. SIO3I7]